MDILESKLDDNDYKLVLAIVQKGFGDEVVEASRNAGASGACILQGKGTTNEKRKFFNFNIEPEKEVVLILVESEKAVPITKAIYSAVDYKSEARGLVFVLPVSHVSGMSHSKLELDPPALDSNQEKIEVKNDNKN